MAITSSGEKEAPATRKRAPHPPPTQKNKKGRGRVLAHQALLQSYVKHKTKRKIHLPVKKESGRGVPKKRRLVLKSLADSERAKIKSALKCFWTWKFFFTQRFFLML